MNGLDGLDGDWIGLDLALDSWMDDGHDWDSCTCCIEI